MSRLAKTFERLQAEGRKALIPYITAGDPHPQHTLALMQALGGRRCRCHRAGRALQRSDGRRPGDPARRRARAWCTSVRLLDVLEMVRAFRQHDSQHPGGADGLRQPDRAPRVCRALPSWKREAAGVDGVLVVDYPPEEADGVCSRR